MKKIYIMIIVLFVSLNFISFASATTEQSYWVRCDNDIEIISKSNLHTITVNSDIDIFYLFKLTDLSGNDISYEISGANITTSSNIEFKRNYLSTYTSLDMDSVKIIRTTSDVIEVSFIHDDDFVYSLLEKSNNEINTTLTDFTSITNDMLILNANISSYNSNNARVITMGVGLNYNQISKYLYLYIPQQFDKTISVHTFTFKAEEHFESVDVNFISNENNIYKFRVRDITTNFFEEYNHFELISLGSDIQNFRSSSIATQDILLDIQDDEVNFTTIDTIKNYVNAYYSCFDFEEPDKLLGNAFIYEYRFHYLLFDVYVDNKKINSLNHLESVTLQYDMSWFYRNDEKYMYTTYEDRLYNENFRLYSILWGEDWFDWIREIEDERKSSHIEIITSSEQLASFNSKIESFSDYLANIFKNKKENYPFNTLFTMEENKYESFEYEDFYGYTYALFFGKEANDTLIGTDNEYAFCKRKRFFSLRFRDIISYAENIEFAEVEYEYLGQKYTAKIDKTNISYNGPSEFWPGDPPYTTESCVICDFFGWDWCIFCISTYQLSSVIFIVATIVIAIILFIVLSKYNNKRKLNKIYKAVSGKRKVVR